LSIAGKVNETLSRHLGVEVRRSGNEFPAHYDDAACRIIRGVRPRTMTSREKLYALVQAVRYVSRSDVVGDIVECGVWRGGSMQAIARVLTEERDNARHLYLCDTFEGMPPPAEHDLRADGLHASQLLVENTDNVRAFASCEDVEKAMRETAYPWEKIHFVEGMVEDTLPDQAPEKIALLRLDTDWYESTRHELECLYERLVPGGILILDDYGWWQGSRKAVDEWLDANQVRIFLSPMAEGRSNLPDEEAVIDGRLGWEDLCRGPRPGILERRDVRSGLERLSSWYCPGTDRVRDRLRSLCPVGHHLPQSHVREPLCGRRGLQ
jgi:O-methyltransferase